MMAISNMTVRTQKGGGRRQIRSAGCASFDGHKVPDVCAKWYKLAAVALQIIRDPCSGKQIRKRGHKPSYRRHPKAMRVYHTYQGGIRESVVPEYERGQIG